MSYQIAIPSYHRSDRIGRLTLHVLAQGGVDMRRVDVWVASEEEGTLYRPIVEAYGANVVVHGLGPGIGATRNAIAQGYAPGTRLLELDDDIHALNQAVDSKTLVPVSEIHGWIEKGFELADGKLWCLYPSCNPYYMHPKRIRYGGLWYAEGAWFGFTVAPRHDNEHQMVACDHGEDFERSIKYFLHDGGIVRLDMLAVRSRYWVEPGGLQDTRTPENVRAGVDYVCRTYPGLAKAFVTKAGRLNIRLKVIR